MPLLLSGLNTHEGARDERDHERRETEIKERKLVGGMKTEHFSQVLFKMLFDVVENVAALLYEESLYISNNIKQNTFLCIDIKSG